MKWKTEPSVKPAVGDVRPVRCFAFWPTKLDDGYTVWWEYYAAEQTFTQEDICVDPGVFMDSRFYWKTTKKVRETPCEE